MLLKSVVLMISLIGAIAAVIVHRVSGTGVAVVGVVVSNVSMSSVPLLFPFRAPLPIFLVHLSHF